MGPRDLRPYQAHMADLVYEHNSRGLYLCLDLGLGKTIITLTALRRLLDEFVVRRVLVIAPLLVAETVWGAEIDSWDHTKALTYEILTGSADRRACRANIEADVHIINRENVPWLVEFWGEDWPYDCVVIDEHSSFKNHRKKTHPTKRAIEKAHERARAQIGKSAKESEFETVLNRELRKLKRGLTRFGALCKVRKHIEMVVALSGTPAPNGLLDLWAQIYLLDQGERLGATFAAYRDRWFVSDYMGYSYDLRPGAEEEITQRLSDIMVSLKSEDYLQLPDIVFKNVYVNLPKKAMEEYKRFERTLVSEMYDVEAVSKGVLVNKLLQFSCGSMYQEEGEPVPIHDAKLEALAQIVEEAAGQHILVAYNFKFDLAKIKKKFPKAAHVGDDAEVIRRWNEGKIPMLLAHPASISFGLNLQRGGHIIVWYGFSYSLENYLQLNKRLHRSGQKETVVINHIVARDTADEDVLRALSDKKSVQDDVIEAVKARLENLA